MCERVWQNDEHAESNEMTDRGALKTACWCMTMHAFCRGIQLRSYSCFEVSSSEPLAPDPPLVHVHTLLKSL